MLQKLRPAAWAVVCLALTWTAARAADDCGVVAAGGTATCDAANETPAGAYGDGDGITYAVEDLTLNHSGGGDDGTHYISSGGLGAFGDIVINNLAGATVDALQGAGPPAAIYGASDNTSGTVSISNAGTVRANGFGVSGLAIGDGAGGSAVDNSGVIEVSGEFGRGINANIYGGGLLTVTHSGTITTAHGDGIYAQSFGDGVTTFGEMVVSVTGDIDAVGGSGVYVTGNGGGGGFAPPSSLLATVTTISVSLDGATIDARPDDDGGGIVNGITVFDFGAEVTIDVGSTGVITAHGASSGGILAFAGGLIDLTMDGSIDTTDGGTSGIFLQAIDGSVFVDMNGSVRTASSNATGLFAGGSDDANGNLGTIVADLGAAAFIQTTGERSHALYARGEVNAFLTVAGQLLANGELSDGINSEVEGCHTIEVSGSSTATGSFSAGIYLARPLDQGGFAPGGQGGGGAGLVPDPLPTPQCAADHRADIVIDGNASVQGGFDGSGDGSSGRAAGIAIVDVAFNSLGDPVLVDIENRGDLGALSDQAVLADIGGPGVGVDLANSGEMIGTLVLRSSGNDNSVTNSGLWGLRGWADSDGDGLRDLERIALSVLDGDDDLVTNTAAGSIALLSTPGTGVGGAGIEEAVIEGVERFRNAGLITMADAATGLGSALAGDRLTIVGGFIGQDGTLALDSVLNAGGSGNQETDRFLVQGSATGTTRVLVSNAGGLGAETGGASNQGISIVQVAGQSSAGAFVLGAPVVAGAYNYQLNAFAPGASDASERDERLAGQGGFWDFRLQTSAADIFEGTREYPLIQAAASQAFWTDLDVLHRRMGELRVSIADPFRYQTQPGQTAALGAGDVQVAVRPGAGPGGPEGAWFKGYGSEMDIEAGAGFAQSVYGGIAGYDLGFENVLGQGDMLLLGPTLGIAGSRVDFDQSASELTLDVYRVGAYAVYFDGGFYLDGVAKLDIAEATFVAPASSTEAEFGLVTAGASLEAGYTFMLDERNFLEPQAQIAYSHTWAEDFEDASGAEIDLDDSDSLIGRLGLRAGTVFATGQRGRIAPYLQAGVLHEFLGDSAATVSDLDFDASLAGTSYEVGFGAHAADLGSNVSAYVDLLYRFGEDVEGVKGLVGLRYSW